MAQQRSGNESLWECDTKTIPDADDGFGGRTPACREYTHPRDRANSRVYAAIPGNTIIGPVVQVYMVKFLDNYGIEIQIPFTVSQGQASWVILCREKNRYVENISVQDPGRAHTSSELLLERVIAKFNEPWDVEMESSSASVGKPSATQTEKSVEGIGESHANQVVEQLKTIGQRRVYLQWSQEVERYSRLWTLQQKHSFCRDLKICCQIGVPL